MKNNHSKPETPFSKAKLYEKYLYNCGENTFEEYKKAYDRTNLEIDILDDKVIEALNNSETSLINKGRLLKYNTLSLINSLPKLKNRNIINNN